MRIQAVLSVMSIISLAIALALLAKPRERATAFSVGAVTAGQAHSCSLTSAGAVQCWGFNVDGELGIGTFTPPYELSAVPLPVCASGVWNGTACGGGSAFSGVYGISQGATASHTCATIIWLVLECWGSNSEGQLGNGTSANIAVNPTFTLCSSTSANCNSTNHFLAGITAIGAGMSHTCAVDNGGYVWCWGSNGSGELGDGTTVARSIAKRVCATGSGEDCTNGALLSGIAAVAVGINFSCALTTGGGVKCWGSNIYGQLGDGTTTNTSLPVSVSGLTSGVSAVTLGDAHACAALTSGGAKCWGFNLDGELGDGTEVSKTAPVSVICGASSGQFCSAGTALTSVSKIAAGSGHTCAVLSNPSASKPSVECWGSQYFGQLGNNVSGIVTSADNPAGWFPPPISTGAPAWVPQASAISTGGAHTCSIIGTYVECWGWNFFGQVGNGMGSDTTTWVNQDVDKDGCRDSQELAPNHVYGGQRDPTNFWDFFDTPDDTNTTLNAQVTASATPPFSITVQSGTFFPFGPDTFYIDNEKFSYDIKFGNTFSITARALDRTTAAEHNTGARIIRNVRDKKVDSSDASRVNARNGSSGNAAADPLALPPLPPAYGSAFDRTSTGPNAWNLGAPNGTINGTDYNLASGQVGDSCQ